MHEIWTISTAHVPYTSCKTTQIWWLANMEYKHSKVWLLCLGVLLLLSCDVFVIVSAHPLSFLDKWFV